LHRGSRRADGPLIRVNSAALPRDLVESEMFGHEPGAFTGAVHMHRGRFELADGGTLFLDEVGDLGADAQGKLLRAIESGRVERLGGQRTIEVDVRVIAATNRDLRDEVRAGRFREDLFYRLAVVPIVLPPLRQRRDDVPLLAAHLLARLQRRTGRDAPTLLPAAIGRLVRYDWPGNVRELANVCERLAILHGGRPIDAHAVDAVLGPATDRDADASLADRLDAFERTQILDALNASAGNVTVAAQRLRTDRGNLYRRMRRLGIER
jgi:two-component system, NtrC family, nitrogen regulation response regulator NtrX